MKVSLYDRSYSFFRDNIRSHKNHFVAVALIFLAVVAANGYYIFRLADPNPLLLKSGLAVTQTAGPLSGLNTIDPNDGFTTQALGHQAAEQWLHGHIPYWNHFEGVGAPLAGEMQSAAFFPLILLLHFSNGLFYFQFILELVAGISTYFLLRKLKLGDLAATLGGIAFALNGTFAWLHNAVFNPVAFLPLMILGVEIAYDKSKSKQKGGWLLLAIGLALSLYSGFPETAFINFLLIVVWSIYRLVKTGLKIDWVLFKKLGMAVAVGLFLSAPILIAFLGYLPYANIGGHNGAFSHISLGLSSFPTTFMPYIYGPIFKFITFSDTPNLTAFWGSVGGYYSAAVLYFAVFGLLSKQYKTLKIILLAWILIGFAKTFGLSLISDIFSYIPGIRNAAFYRYANSSISVSLIILAAFGIEELLKKQLSTRRIITAFSICFALLSTQLMIAHSELNHFIKAPAAKYWASGSSLLAISIIVSLTAIALLSNRLLSQKVLKAGISLILVSELLLMFILPQLTTPKTKIDTGPIRFLQTNLGLDRFYTLGPISPNYGSYFNAASINQNDLPVPKAWGGYINSQLNTNTDPLLFTGSYSRNKNGPSSEDEFFKHMQKYQSVGVKFLVTQKDSIDSGKASLYMLKKVFTNFNVDIYELSGNISYYSFLNSKCHVVSQTRDQISTDCSGKGTLIRKELYLPGWNATVNSSRVKLETDGQIFQKISLPSGISSTKFIYNPPFMQFGYICFAAAVLIISVTLFPKNRNKAITKLQKKIMV